MRVRALVGALLLVGLFVPFFGCGSATEVDTIAVNPSAVSVAVGATAQLTATGTITHGSHPSSTENLTSLATWTSSSNSVATVSSSGVVTGVASGTATITASYSGFGGLITSNEVTVTVTGSGGGTTSTNNLTAINIIPSAQSVGAPNQTSQFIAIGTTSSGSTVDVTNQVTWNSSSPQIATVSASGLVTGLTQGSTTITALATNANGTVATGTATFTVAAGASEPYTALSLNPTSIALSATGKQTGQLIALATSGSTGLNVDATNLPQVTWSSSIPTIATVSSYPAGGLVTGVSAGQTTVTAKLTNPDGTVLTATTVVNVAVTPAPEPLLSLQIIPNDVTVLNLQDTGQFIAIGTFSSNPSVKDLTNDPSLTWLSSAPDLFPINTTGQTGAQAGIITAFGSGTAVVIAEAENPDTSIATATATFNCPLVLPDLATGQAGSCYPGSETPSLLATLTIFETGLDTTHWLVTAPSATGTPNVLHCGPGSVAAGLGSSVCVATYPIGTTVTITAPATAAKFGGYSANCINPVPNPPTQAGPNSCTLTLTTNDTLGVIFN